MKQNGQNSAEHVNDSGRGSAIARAYTWLTTHRLGKSLLLGLLLLFWVFLWLVEIDIHPHADSYCPINHFAGIPCPGCGGTRGTYLIANGHWLEGTLMNPFALGFVLLLLGYQFTLLVDITRPQGSHLSERYMANAWKWTSKLWWLILPLMLLNWLWNIDKFMPD